MFLNAEKIAEYVTVEVSFFCFCVTNEIMKFLNDNLYLQKACRFNQTIEPDLDTPCDDEGLGILFVSEISSKYAPISFFLSHVITIFATSWSDEAGRRRRPLIFIPLISQIITALLGCVYSYFWYIEPTYAVFSEIIIHGTSGGMSLITYASQMYLCDICLMESRTMRLGVLGAIKVITILIGKGGSGFILRSFGFLFSYFLCYLVSTMGLVLGLLFIKDMSIPMEKQKKIHQFINIGVVVDSFRVVFKKSLGRKRIVVLSLLVTNVISYFTTCGEFAVMYLYLRYRFRWDERKYSAFMLYKFSVSTFGILFSSVILSRRLKWHDGLIGMFAGFWDTMAVIGLFFASLDWQIYLIPLLDVFHGTALTVSTSFMSKYYDSTELGRLGAVYNVVGLAAPFAYPLYNVIFQKTLDTSFPAAFCVASVALDIITVVLYGAAYLYAKKLDKQNSIGVDGNPAITSK
ncbi:lysosomal proton-coupled steroid conjugate and bile acid symporter SLC46A3-like [Planococcus citri]|uniref:lysosomal proton-coupled steroid conjugate and bile acid symporter SLC46A3-like n=1 Tax=Planococcus citri TaxID=170843 RepID=UPI0031F96DDF